MWICNFSHIFLTNSWLNILIFAHILVSKDSSEHKLIFTTLILNFQSFLKHLLLFDQTFIVGPWFAVVNYCIFHTKIKFKLSHVLEHHKGVISSTKSHFSRTKTYKSQPTKWAFYTSLCATFPSKRLVQRFKPINTDINSLSRDCNVT